MSQQKRSSVVEDADLVLELLAPACAREMGQVVVSRISSLQKPIPDGELEELCLICSLPKKHLF